jgi:hypothetical protein
MRDFADDSRAFAPSFREQDLQRLRSFPLLSFRDALESQGRL